MNNEDFLSTISKSFVEFLNTSARSNKKLKILHGAIAQDMEKKLGSDYAICSLGCGAGKEVRINGRYMDKTVDIAIYKGEKDLGAIGVKFVMNNYSQNSNNYFEGMLGETANIRANKKKYFQIIVLPEELPYYDKSGKITHWEKITNHNIDKYIKLSNDDEDVFFHTPIKTLILIIKLPKLDVSQITDRDKYKNYYLNLGNVKLELSTNISDTFGERVVFNNYESFMEKIIFYIKSI